MSLVAATQAIQHRNMAMQLIQFRPDSLCLWLLSGLLVVCCWHEAATATGFTRDEGLQLGERLYREGIRADGKPVQALIAGDIFVDGRMFTCVNCHQRSGLGSVEGSIVTWPITGKELFVPRRRTGAWNPAVEGHGPGAGERWSLPPQNRAADARPAYTAETLARAIRTGVAADGRVLSHAMPRYELEDREMELLIRYLKDLSVNNDPGVDGQTLRFATVVTDGVSAADREAMLSVLQAHIDARNTQTRPHLRRVSQGPFYKTEQYGSYRKLALDVWELTGPADIWREQLESYYRSRPVFALLGGIGGTGGWAPIHAFCEDNEIPSIFPVTDQPVVSESDWYTLYFSKGLYQEGETAARFLQASGKVGPDTRIIQVYRQGGKGETLAQGFQDAWSEYGGRTPENRQPEENGSLPASWWQGPDAEAASVLLLWLAPEDLAAALRSQVMNQGGETILFASGGLLEGKLDRIPARIRNIFYMTYPESLPGENKHRLMALQRWLKVRGIPATNLAIQSKMYFLGWMLADAMKYMRGEFYRDYFMESFDMMTDQDAAIAVFPRLSFGPGQRYASKGCYIVQFGGDGGQELVKVSDWVIN
jgi:hypothetical protein